jgi:beta-glucosidase
MIDNSAMSLAEFRTASIPEILKKLTKDEKILLISAPNWWHTNKVDRLGIPSVKMSDGPNGVRGSSHFVSTPAHCIPVSMAILLRW